MVRVVWLHPALHTNTSYREPVFINRVEDFVFRPKRNRRTSIRDQIQSWSSLIIVNPLLQGEVMGVVKPITDIVRSLVQLREKRTNFMVVNFKIRLFLLYESPLKIGPSERFFVSVVTGGAGFAFNVALCIFSSPSKACSKSLIFVSPFFKCTLNCRYNLAFVFPCYFGYNKQ